MHMEHAEGKHGLAVCSTLAAAGQAIKPRQPDFSEFRVTRTSADTEELMNG